MKIVAVLYPGGPAAAETPELLGCVENALGLRHWVESQGHELVAISDTEAGLEAHLPTTDILIATPFWPRSEEHTSELQSRRNLVCRLLLEKKKKTLNIIH